MKTIFDGSYYDGQSAARHPVLVYLTDDALMVERPAGETTLWPYDLVRQTQGDHPGAPVRFEFGSEPAQVLVVPEPDVLVGIHQLAGRHSSHFANPRRRMSRRSLVLGASATALLAAVVLYFWGLPLLVETVACRVPLASEEKLGQLVLAELAPASRRYPESVNAEFSRFLSPLTSRIDTSPYRLRIVVVKSPVANAFALPGGTIVVLSGLLEKTRTPEALMGVLSHEVAHILLRHPTKGVVRKLSICALLSWLSAGTPAGALPQVAALLGELNYSRADEAAADREGVRLLGRAGLDQSGLIAFFDAVGDRPESAGYLRYLSTHPSTGERIAALRALVKQAEAALPFAPPAPPVPADRWQALLASASN